MGEIFMTIIGGAIIGALARLLKPGADPMGWILTILFGIAGAYIGGLLFPTGFLKFVVAIVAAIVLLFVYDAIFKKKKV